MLSRLIMGGKIMSYMPTDSMTDEQLLEEFARLSQIITVNGVGRTIGEVAHKRRLNDVYEEILRRMQNS